MASPPAAPPTPGALLPGALPEIPSVPMPDVGRPPSGRAADVTTDDPEAVAQLVASVLGVHPPRWTADQFAARTGVDATVLLRMRRSLGFADPPAGEPVFSEDDEAIVGVINTAMDAGAIDLDRQLALNRVLGSSMSRVASAAIAAFVEALDAEDGMGTASELDDLDLSQIIQAMRLTLPMLDRTIGLVWRRHLASAARRAVLAAGADDIDTGTVVVGFADLVDFTERTEQLDETDLAAAMARFDDVAFDTVSALGGRVVKMIGDEVMFCAPSVESAAAICWRLIDLCEVDEALTTLRAGFACGSAIDQDGDIIGPAANLAHRISSLAQPGTVLAPADLAPPEEPPADAARGGLVHQPGDTTGYRWSTMRFPMDVRGIGTMKLASVQPQVHVPVPATPEEIEQLTRLGNRAFSNVPTEGLGGWTMRLAGGGRRRANSVSTLDHPGIGLDDALRSLRSRYESLGLPPRVVITPLSQPDGLDATLQAKGWRSEAVTLVMVGDLREIRHLSERRSARVPLMSYHRPFPSWRVGFDDLAGETADADLAIMYGAGETNPIIESGLGSLRRGLPPLDLGTTARPRLFAAALEAEAAGAPSGATPDTEAVGAGIVDGPWLGVFSMWTRAGRRRRGLAAAVLAELAAWGTREGCRLAYLQVEETNRTGRSVYTKLGFAEAYRYHYRTAPPTEGPTGAP